MFSFYIEGMSIMFYDLLVVYLMKLSVNKFYNVMSMYVYNMSFSISWIKDHIKKLIAFVS